DSVTFKVIVCLLTAFCGTKALASCRFEEGAAAFQYVGDIFGVELLDVVLNHSFVSAVDTVHLKVVIESGSDDRTNCSIHSRSVSTRGEYANFFYGLRFHFKVVLGL